MNTNLEDNSMKSTLANSNTYLEDFGKEIQTVTVSDDFKTTEYVVLIFDNNVLVVEFILT